MSRKHLFVILVGVITFIIPLASLWAEVIPPISDKVQWDKINTKRDIKHYENKEYKTYEEYKQAYYDGKISSMWLWMHMGKKDKTDIIDTLRKMFKDKDNVPINKPTEYYVKAIDEMFELDPEAQHFKLGAVFKTIAVMEYDFDEGIDKDETAKKWLGEYYPVAQEYRARERR